MDKSLIKKSFRQMLNKNLRLTLAATIASLLVAGIAHAFGVTPAGSANPLAGSSDAARQGEEIFGRNCQQCHNTRGHGGKCPQLVRGAWAPEGANSDIFMFETIFKGRPNTQMGAWGEALTEREIWQVIAFLREEAARVKVLDGSKKNNPDEDLWY